VKLNPALLCELTEVQAHITAHIQIETSSLLMHHEQRGLANDFSVPWEAVLAKQTFY